MSYSRGFATFLLVDDDIIGIMAMKRALKKLGIVNHTLVANDGFDALDRLSSAADMAGGVLPPFIVLLDMHMPRMDGQEFLNELARNETLQTAIIFIFQEESRLRGGGNSTDNLIVDYISKDDAKASIGKGLSKLQTHAELIEYHSDMSDVTAYGSK